MQSFPRRSGAATAVAAMRLSIPRALVGVLVVITVAGGHVAIAGAAAPEVSYLEATTNPNPMVLDLNLALSPLQNTGTVTVGLDANCPNAFGNGQDITIVPGTVPVNGSNEPLVSVSPSVSATLHCGDTATFTLTALHVGGPASLSFSPVAANNGLQKKVGGTSITIEVVDTTQLGGLDCTLTPNAPECTTGDGELPAAPAVANAHLNLNTDGIATQCKSYFQNKKDWRGRTISKLTSVMEPPAAKNGFGEGQEADWVLFVLAQLDTVVCPTA